MGCEACQYTGCSGRLALFEILSITPSLKEIITPNVSAIALKKAAEKEGFESLFMDGLRKAIEGLTTIEEVFRVAPPDTDQVFYAPVLEPAVPKKEKTLEAPPEQRLASVMSAKPKKIVVVDDNDVILRIVQNILESEGYLVVTAKNGLEAMKRVFEERPDLIIMLTAKDDVDSDISC